MRQVATWIVVVGMAAALVGCGHDRGADGTPDSAEQAVREMLDALARGDAQPLCEALDLREVFAASHPSVPFETFAEEFSARYAEQVGGIYVVGESAHQVVGQYEDGGRTVVKVRFRPGADASWAEWDLPFRRIDGAWRMGLAGVEAILGLPEGPPPLDGGEPAPPTPPPPPAEEPAEPTKPLDDAEQRALAALRTFVAQGGDVRETLDESVLLNWPAMDVTRLHEAAERGWLAVAAFLVEHGADVRAVAPSKSHHNQLTPLDVAREAGHPELVALLQRALEARRATGRVLELTFPDPRNAAALVAFDDPRMRLLTEDMAGQAVDHDLFVEPADPEILALTSRFGALKHIGADAAVLLASAPFDDLRTVPGEPPSWRGELPTSSIQPGTTFFVRSGSGRIYKVELQQCDRTRLALRYALLPVSTTGSSPSAAATNRSVASDRQAVRDMAQAFVRASQKGDLKAAAALCTDESARSLLAVEVDEEHRPAISEYDVREVNVSGDRATASVWVRNDVFPEGQDEFTLKLTLERVGEAWRIDGMELEPHWEPADLGPEVGR